MTHETPFVERVPGIVQDRPDRLQRVPWGAVTVFVVVSFGLAWLVATPLWIMGTDSPAFPLMLSLLASAMMFTPTVAALAATFVMRVPLEGTRLQFLGIWPLRPAKKLGGVAGFCPHCDRLACGHR
ncbi:hypothetical protein [Leucobacter coleopterorum]|uniref:hypothetical protein n=1 Tax=Leucobacter coleopterorum TaxID=2714933 RepID=UPI001FCBD10E|nr:hypothetical protein [Leucobacter coleopterorum]